MRCHRLIGLHPGFSSDELYPSDKELICAGCGQPIGHSGGAYRQDSETGKIYLVATEGPHRGCDGKLENRLASMKGDT